MTTKTKLALAAVLMLGLASGAQAGSGHHGDSDLSWARVHPDPTISRDRASVRRPNMNASSRQPIMIVPSWDSHDLPGLD